MKWGGKVNKIFLLALSNIRKTKGHTVSLFIMFLISGLLLNAGLLVFINFGSFFDKLTNELHTSDVYYIIPNQLYNDQVDEYIKKNSNVISLQKEEPFWISAKTSLKDESTEGTYLLNDADSVRKLSKWKFVGKHLPADKMSIYIPYVCKIKNNYRLNDKFTLYMNNKKLTFTIKGFIEDAYFSSYEMGIIGLYLPHEAYTKVSDTLGSSNKSTLIFANLKKNNLDMEKNIKKRLTNKSAFAITDYTDTMYSMNKVYLKMARIMMANVLSVMIVIFAAMIVSVCLIVVRFRIGNSIEDDMPKIGALKAIGYTSRQIMLSIVTQFGSIALTGSILGIFLSYFTTPLLSEVFEKQSGIKWIQGFDGKISSIALCFILVFVVALAYLAAGKIKKIHPIVALRGGIVTHSFRKNHISLEKSKGSLPLVLSFKSLLQNKRQDIMIMIILGAVSFCGAFSVAMFYNTTINIQAFKEVPGEELSNAVAVLKPDSNTELVRNISKMKHVRKVQFIDRVGANLEDNSMYVEVMKDYSQKETNTVYEGRYPLHSNEIAISGYLADMLDKKVGDTVTLTIGNEKSKYMITGLSSGANFGGRLADITYEGLKKLNPQFKQQTLQIYLDTGTDSANYVKKLKEQFKDSLLAVNDMDKLMKEGTSVYTSMVSKVGCVMLSVTILVVILVLYFVINSSVTRRRRELGIQKAIGFTTWQLMNQISLAFLLPVILGVIIGTYFGTTQLNNIMSVAMRSAGVMKASYLIQPVWAVLFGVAIILISYATSMLITYRIRKISAYSLVSE